MLIFDGCISSEISHIKPFVKGALKKLYKFIDNEDIMFDIKLILNELIANGIFHGNTCLDSKVVNLSLKIKDDKIIIEVKDEGKGINYDFQSYNPLDLKCCGRGLVLVKGLSDELLINDNRIVAIKNIE